MNRFFPAIPLLFFVHLGFSQHIEYFNNDDLLTDSSNCNYFKVGHYTEVTDWTDTVKTFYCNNKKLRSKEFYNLGKIEGIGFYYHPNGRLKEKINHKDGKAFGVSIEYYPSGNAKCTRMYLSPLQIQTKTFHTYIFLNAWNSLGVQTVKNYKGYFKDETSEGKIVNGLPDSLWITYDHNGKKILEETFTLGEFVEGDRFIGDKKIHFSKREVAAQPKDGMEQLYKEIGKNLRYPTNARRMGLEGRVFINFIIEKDGLITRAKIMKGFDAPCDEEALRVVKLFKPWIPGTLQGLPVRQSFVLPINFKLGR